MEEKIIPLHVGIIMDGNGRYAKERGLPRSLGHKEGAKNLKTLARHIFECGIRNLSVFAFSTENFKRDKSEVDYLMNLFIKHFHDDYQELCDMGVKVVFSGRRQNLRPDVLESMDYITNKSKDNKNGILNICLNYGGQTELVDMTKQIVKQALDGKITTDDITVDLLKDNLYQDLPPLDLVIRTSGEYRISNFMLYQMAYSEFYFTDIYFPAFKAEDFDKALKIFQKRDRRFGGVKHE